MRWWWTPINFHVMKQTTLGERAHKIRKWFASTGCNWTLIIHRRRHRHHHEGKHLPCVDGATKTVIFIDTPLSVVDIVWAWARVSKKCAHKSEILEDINRAGTGVHAMTTTVSRRAGSS